MFSIYLKVLTAQLWFNAFQMQLFIFEIIYVVVFVVLNDFLFMVGTAAMLLVMVWRPHISILSISTLLRCLSHLARI